MQERVKNEYRELYDLHRRIENAQKVFEKTQKDLKEQIAEMEIQVLNYLPEGHNPEEWVNFSPNLFGRFKDGNFSFYMA